LSRYINSPQVELQVATIAVIDFHPLCVTRRSATAVRRLDFPAQRGTDPFRIVAMALPDHERGRIELLDRHAEDDTLLSEPKVALPPSVLSALLSAVHHETSPADVATAA
jgi:hypothetical protein